MLLGVQGTVQAKSKLCPLVTAQEVELFQDLGVFDHGQITQFILQTPKYRGQMTCSNDLSSTRNMLET